MQKLTVGAAPGNDRFVVVGVAAHITAAAPGGPRYDPSLSIGARRHQTNGIWLCQNDAKLVDSDSEHFTVEMLRKWKQSAEEGAFRAIVSPHHTCYQPIVPTAPSTADAELIGPLALASRDDLLEPTLRLIHAAKTDLRNFRNMPGWPPHAISLNLRIIDKNGGASAFDIFKLAEAIETFKEVVVVAPPGTGKTTTLIQVAEAILSKGNLVALFLPLGEWSSGSDSFFQLVVRRSAFVGTREEDMRQLANVGRLVLVMDGWNELDEASRKRAYHGIRALQREFSRLGIVLSTRRQVLGVPISGPVVEIEVLSEEQQQDIARAMRGPQGEAVLDYAWRTPGVRELVAIPLYLTALLTHTSNGVFPTTKEEVLRLFVSEHERSNDKAENLRSVLFGFHTEMLRALAVDATRSGNTLISDVHARAVIKLVEDQLSADGQISISPQPTEVLNVLVSRHSLVRSGAEYGGVSFQHQQLQEWFAAFEVEELMRASAEGDREARQKLKANILNIPVWEESILFASERLSRADHIGMQAVGASILETITIDPILAAEMIYRSAIGVWEEIRDKVITFVRRWHAPGKVDRAVRFMITTGRSEFSPLIWPLISNPDNQVHLSVLRAARRFRSSVLGSDVQTCIANLPEKLRETIISEIALWSDMEGIELACRLAQSDESPKVQASVIESLMFRRADRLAAEVLRKASDEVWHLLARNRGAENITNSEAAERLRRERQHYIENEPDPFRKLSLLLDPKLSTASLGHQVRALIEAVDFPTKNNDAGWVIVRAHDLYPDDVTTALFHRLEAGREIPFQTTSLLRAAGFATDAGPIVDLVIQTDGQDKVAETAVIIVGPQTVGRLIDKAIEIHAKLRSPEESPNEAWRQQYFRLLDLISNTGVTSFIQAVLNRSATDDPFEIALLADLVARHGRGELEWPLHLNSQLYEQIISAVGRWAEVLLASSLATRTQLSEVARAIGRLAAQKLFPALRRMLAEDLARWRHAHHELVTKPNRQNNIKSDAHTSWNLQYGEAFAAIGDAQVVNLMITYLPEAGFFGFGFDAACVLKQIWQRDNNSSKGNRQMFWPVFSEVDTNRKARQDRSTDRGSSPFADAIIAVIDNLVKPGSGEEAHRHALRLAQIAFSLPYTTQTEIIDKLLQLPRPFNEKQDLFRVLVLAGEIVCANTILDCIKTLLTEAKTKPWLLDQSRGKLDGWLELLPFSDRPSATLDALQLLEPHMRQPWQLRRLLSALGYAFSHESEKVLNLLARQDANFLNEHEWLAALEKQGTLSAASMLLEFICDGAFSGRRGGISAWTLSQNVGSAMHVHADFRAKVYQRYENMPSGPGKAILEDAIAEAADMDGILVLIRSHVSQGMAFSGSLQSAIGRVAVGERPSANFAGAHEVFSVPVPELRKKLFAMTEGDSAESRLAAACLIAIDELRDENGVAESEPRHPDVESGRPWPMTADLP